MATVQARSPGIRIDVGDKVLCSAEVVDTTPIAGRLATFKTAHTQYTAADVLVQSTLNALRAQQAKVESVDVDQDGSLDVLATSLAGDGFPRLNPFKPFGAPAPSVLKRTAASEKAAQVITLEASVLKKAAVISQKSEKAAIAAGDAARKVLDAAEPLAMLEKEYSLARARRAALEPAWERAFANLKRSAKSAEDDGHVGLFAALFDRPAPPKKSKTKRAAAADDAPVSKPA